MNASQPGRINVVFKYDEMKEEQLLNVAQLTALQGTDLIYIDEFKEPKRIDKKIWVRNVNGVALHIQLK